MHTHLLHVQCLLFHGAVRNAWLQDPKLQVTPNFLLIVDSRMIWCLDSQISKRCGNNSTHYLLVNNSSASSILQQTIFAAPTKLQNLVSVNMDTEISR